MEITDEEQVILQILRNDPSQFKFLNFPHQHFPFNEKDLRDAAHAEVANAAFDIDKASRKRKPLNPEEKAKQSRDRNREHAKNTRLRKKAFILKLKELVDELNKQKEFEDLERRTFAENVLTQYLEKKNVVLLFLTYRARNDPDKTRWGKILDDKVVMKLPITPYRFFPKEEICGSQRIVNGIDRLMADAHSLSIMVEGIGINSNHWKDAISSGQNMSKLVYHTCKDDTISGPNIVMCRFIMRIEGETLLAFSNPCVQAGMLCCRFNDQNKIIFIEIMFDVMSFMQQLQRTAGLVPEHSVVPNTLEMALQPCNEIRLLVKSTTQFECAHANLHFTRFTGKSQGSVENVSVLNILSMNQSDRDNFESLLQNCSFDSGPKSTVVTFLNLRSSNSAHCYVKILPLSSDTDEMTHILLTFSELNTQK